MAIDVKKIMNSDKKQNSIPKLGKPYLFYDKQKFEFVVPIVYNSSGFLGLDIRRVKATDRHFVLSNINKLKFSKKQLKNYDYKKSTNFFEIDKDNWHNLDTISYKREQ
jgi:hypothetical protein